MNVFNNLMAPLGKEHCMIIYYFGIFLFAMATLTLLMGIYNIFDTKNKNKSLVIVLVYFIQAFVTYFSYYLYRIAYSICIKAL